MFQVDERFKFPVPSPLTREGVHCFEIVEALLNEPVWLIHATEHSDAGFLVSRRRVLVHTPALAMQILSSPQWSAKRIYVLLPEYMTGLSKLSLCACSEVWRCDEPDSEVACWRLVTERGKLLWSPFGTPLGDERNPRLVWRDEHGETEI